MSLSDLLTTKLLRTTDNFLAALNAIDIVTVKDLLLYLPRAYEDLSTMRTLENVEDGEKVTIRGTVTDVKMIRTRRKKMALVQGIFTDMDGNSCSVVWFNQPHIMRMLAGSSDLVLTGKIGWAHGKLTLQSPIFEPANRELLHTGRIVAVYPQHSILSTRWLREKMALVREAASELEETLPISLIEKGQWTKDKGLKTEELMGRAEAIRELHFPQSPERLKMAQDRMAFEELYNLQLTALRRKRDWQEAVQDRLKIPMNVGLIKAFFASLHFKPTNSQRIAIYEILRDIEKDVPMSRLLEGDVGSGKTLVATAVMANVVYYGGQCALMVPTEVLASQHAEGITKMMNNAWKYSQNQAKTRDKGLGTKEHDPLSFALRPYPPAIALLTGSTPKEHAKELKLGLARGTIDIVVGTHALIQESVVFKDLKLAIIDEQHRFGVEQRERLKEKGSPHVLAMTATPIPRTLALTAYGDHDLSVLLEKPGNRKPIKTKVVSPRDRRTVELFIEKEIAEGRQVYVICPLIAESDDLADVRNVTNEAKRVQEVFPRRTVASLHGKLTPKEKDMIMREYKERKTNILVSTSVIEVGIDVPNASIILIEGAERFGLAQLHQLRGRVGRADHQSYCFLCTTEISQAHSERLKAMEQYTDGFRLAEIDLKLRGPGELYGTRQSGIIEIRAGALMNPELVMRARNAAMQTLEMKEEKILVSASP